jgi:hypothetical protein
VKAWQRRRRHKVGNHPRKATLSELDIEAELGRLRAENAQLKSQDNCGLALKPIQAA